MGEKRLAWALFVLLLSTLVLSANRVDLGFFYYFSPPTPASWKSLGGVCDQRSAVAGGDKRDSLGQSPKCGVCEVSEPIKRRPFRLGYAYVLSSVPAYHMLFPAVEMCYLFQNKYVLSISECQRVASYIAVTYVQDTSI